MLVLKKAFVAITATASIIRVLAIPLDNANLSTQSTDGFISLPHNSVQFCTGALGSGCTHIIFEPLKCIDFKGVHANLDRRISTVVIPTGYECLFTNGFGCTPVADRSLALMIALNAGTYHMSNVNAGANFKDKARSFGCVKV